MKNLSFWAILLGLIIMAQMELSAQDSSNDLPLLTQVVKGDTDVEYELCLYKGTINQITGVLSQVNDSVYRFYYGKGCQFDFKPRLKVNPYSGEKIPFNISEFLQKPDFTTCELLDFSWYYVPEDTDKEKYGEIRGKYIIGENGILRSVATSDGLVFFVKDNHSYNSNNRYNYYSRDYNTYNLNNLNRDNSYRDIFLTLQNTTQNNIPSTDVVMVADSTGVLNWNPETLSVTLSDGVLCWLDAAFNPVKYGYPIKDENNPSNSKVFSITKGARRPISFSENDNVITLKYDNGDYCKFSKMRDNRLFEGIMHFKNGILRASVTPEGEIKQTFECNGPIYKKNNTYNGFTADMSSAKLILDPKSTSQYYFKFDDLGDIVHFIDSSACTNGWILTSTGEKAVWSGGKLITESLKEKKKQEEIANSERTQKEVIASYKATYGATTIDNIMNGRITVGMPWALVGSVFPNTLYNSSGYSKTYKVINNIPRIDYSNKKLAKQEYGMGNLVWVKVQNGKVTNVTYTNHR